MRIVREIRLHEFDFWAGGKTLAQLLTMKELEQIEEVLGFDFYELTETELNDIFWFEDEYIAEILGFADVEIMWDVLAEREV